MLQRPLGFYERYSLARHNVDHTPGVVFTCQLSSEGSDASFTQLLKAVKSLLIHEPLLSSSVADSRTNSPRFNLESIEPSRVVVEKDSIGGSNEEALLEGIQAINDLDIESAPLWRVFIYRKNVETGKTRIVVAVHHVLGDGGATRNLFVQLLTLLQQDEIDLSPPKPLPDFPPSLESTVDVRPSKWFILQQAFSTFIAPRLPSIFYTPSIPFWPNPSEVSPIDKGTLLKLFFLPKEILLPLSTVSKSHQVLTLQPVFTISALTAISNVVLSRRLRHSSSSNSSTSTTVPLHIVSQTPISVRSISSGHKSLCTGNYVASIEQSLPSLTLLYLSTTKFWDSIRNYSKFIKEPETLRKAKQGMGLLGYLPRDIIVDDERDSKGRVQTGWEKTIEDQMKNDSNCPWKGGSFEVSNLGRMKEMKGVEEVCWAQPGSGMGVGLAFNTISSNGILSCTATWRQDSIDTETVEEIFKTYQFILTKIAKGEIGEETKLNEL